MTKNIIKQVSSGGFIFYKDNETLEIYVLLIKNHKGEYWLPKGKLEPGESQLDAAFREINEEVGFTSEQIKHIDYCGEFSYGYNLGEDSFLMKDLIINVFEAKEKYLPAPTDWNDLDSVDWYPYKEALELISFTKDKLEMSYSIFIKSNTELNSLYTLAIENLHNQIAKLPSSNNISCILLYGSIYKKIYKTDISDTDIIVVLKDITKKSDDVFDFIFNNFKNPDYFIYSQEEIEKKVSFFTREYVLEYLSKGVCLYGENLFQNSYREITREQYRQSIVIRSIEHIQKARKIYFSADSTVDYKKTYLKKYGVRIAKNILLFKKIRSYDELDLLSNDQVIDVIKEYGLLSSNYSLRDEKSRTIDDYFQLFCELGKIVYDCKLEIKMN